MDHRAYDPIDGGYGGAEIFPVPGPVEVLTLTVIFWTVANIVPRLIRIFRGQEMDAYQIKTNPDPFEPYLIAQGYRVGGLIFLSGQASIDENGNVVGAEDFSAQVDQIFRNLDKILSDAGSSLSRIVKVTIYLTDMARFPQILDLRRRYFTRPYPADTIVEVRALALPELMIEIDVIALAEGEIMSADRGAAPL